VRVVIDVNHWANEYFSNGIGIEEFSSGYIDEANRRIYVRKCYEPVDGVLLHEMPHAATTGDHDDRWFAEMRRLRDAGAPVLPSDVNDHETPLQGELHLCQVFDSETILGKD
jgi:hypothetical protein